MHYYLPIRTVDDNLLLTKPATGTHTEGDYVSLSDRLQFGSTVLRLEPDIIHLEPLEFEDNDPAWVANTLATLRSDGWA